MASLDVIRRITLRAEAEGFEDAARKLQSLGRAEEGLVATSERTEKATGRVEQSFRRIEGSLDPVARALQQYERTQKGVQAAQAQGVTTQARANELISAAESRVIAAASATEKFAEAHKGLSAQSQAALHSIRSVAEQVALGISPVQALTGQMNHLSFAATGEGGLKGAFAGLGPVLSGALRFVNPLTVGLAAVGGAALAANRALDQQREARVATTGGLGRFGQTTAADVGEIANRAAGNGVSIGQAREAVLAFTRAGVESNDVIERGTKLVQRYAATFGGEFADAQKELAGLAAEPAKAIDAVAKRAGIDVDITNHIKLLDSLGNKTGAAKEAFDALDKALVRDADASTDAGRAKAYLSTQLSKSLDLAGRIALFQQPTADTDAGKRAAEQAAAIARPGFAGAVRGETSRGQTAVSPDLIASNAATAKALEDEARGLALVKLRQSETNEAIRKGTEAHDLEVVAINARTAEERAAVVTTQTFLAVVEKTGNDEIARARATQEGDKILAAHNRQQEDAVRIGKANVAMVEARTVGEKASAASAQVLAQQADNYAGAQAAANLEIAKYNRQQQDAARLGKANVQAIEAQTVGEKAAAASAQVLAQQVDDYAGAQAAANIETAKYNRQQQDAARVGLANVQAIQARTVGEKAAAASAQVLAQQVDNYAGAQAAAAQEYAKYNREQEDATRIGAANVQVIMALTTEQKAAAASAQALAQQVDNYAGAQAAANAVVAQAAVTQRDFDRQLAASQGNAMREARAGLQAAQLPIGPGRQREAGQIQATAAAQSQIATIQAQNPNLKIDTAAFVQAAQDVAALGESARQSAVSLQIVQQWGGQAQQLNVQTQVLNESLSKASGASLQVVESGMRQIEMQGLEGDERQKAINSLNGLSVATYNNIQAQQEAAARRKEEADAQARVDEGFRKSLEAAKKGAEGFASAAREAEIVFNTTISAQDTSGKLLGKGVTMTDILTQEGYWRAQLFQQTKAQLDTLNAAHANDNLLQTQKGLQQNAMAVASPLSSLVEQAQSTLDSARDEVANAQKSAADAAKSAQAQPMANATKSEPQLDPYLSRNASVYYGTATEAFYKEVSWQEASLDVAKESASTDQEALQTAQQHLSVAEQQYNTLQSLADSANRMASSGMTPQAIGAELVNALKSAGFAKTAADVAAAADSYAQAKQDIDLQLQQASLQNTMAYAKGEPTSPIQTFSGSTFSSYTATPFTPLQDVALKPHATGADIVLPGTGGEQPYMVSAQPGERLRISPSGDSGGAYQDNRTITTHVYGVTQPEAVAARLEQDEKNRRGYSSAAVRAARLAA